MDLSKGDLLRVTFMARFPRWSVARSITPCLRKLNARPAKMILDSGENEKSRRGGTIQRVRRRSLGLFPLRSMGRYAPARIAPQKGSVTYWTRLDKFLSELSAP